jgi:dTMP kinase
MRGRLIALEGIDGCGKSTQARLLAHRIGEPNVVLTSEPGATTLGARLRQLLLDPARPTVSARAEALLVAADRADHVSEVIVPALADGRWVVSDRYSGSTFAYQGYGRGLDLDALRQLVTFATEGLEADLNVLVDVPLKVARARLRDAAPDRLENLDEAFHERVRDGYAAIAASDPRWVVVDGTGIVEEVAKQVSAALSTRLGPLPVGAR